MAEEKLFPTLLSFLTNAIHSFPDPRRGHNTQYSMRDFTLSAFAAFYCQSPSFLAFQRLMQQARGTNNGKTLFGIQELPTDNQIRNLLDPVAPGLLRPAFEATFRYLEQRGVVASFRSFAHTLLVPLDGTGYFTSESIHCANCSVAHHRGGRVSYAHSALMPAIVKPGCPQVLPLTPEFISPQDGQEKQDCEPVAAKRWITEVASRYSSLGLTLLGDALYATQPMIECVRGEELDYIFVAKPKSHKYFYEELQGRSKLGQMQRLKRTRWTGKTHRTYTYRWINGVRLNDRPDSIEVNWAELTITDEAGKRTFRIAFLSDFPITKENVEALVEAGRLRWKIENEDINNLKTKGYHFEHNFGHGREYLAQLLLALNVLAFLFHTVLELLDQRVALLRKTLPRRDTFFQHLSALSQYLPFDGWQQLLRFMLHGLQLEDPDADRLRP
jgi:hypothetical protein